MNKKANMGVELLVIAVVAILTLVVYYFFIGKGAGIFSRTITCPEAACEVKETGCLGEEQEVTEKTCENKGLTCCMTERERIGLDKVEPKDGTGGTGGNGTGGNGTGGTGGGASEIAIRLGTLQDYDALTAISSGQVYNKAPGEVLKFVTWISNGEKICSINLRNITSETNRYLIHPTWFTGEVTREECDSAHKKEIVITIPEGALGQKFKLDIMAFKSKDLKEDTILGSATIFINVVAAQTTPPAGGDGGAMSSLNVSINGVMHNSWLTRLDRNSTSPMDTIELWEELPQATKCAVEFYDKQNQKIPPPLCIDTFSFNVNTGEGNCQITDKIKFQVNYQVQTARNCSEIMSQLGKIKVIAKDANGNPVGEPKEIEMIYTNVALPPGETNSLNVFVNGVMITLDSMTLYRDSSSSMDVVDIWEELPQATKCAVEFRNLQGIVMEPPLCITTQNLDLTTKEGSCQTTSKIQLQLNYQSIPGVPNCPDLIEHLGSIKVTAKDNAGNPVGAKTINLIYTQTYVPPSPNMTVSLFRDGNTPQPNFTKGQRLTRYCGDLSDQFRVKDLLPSSKTCEVTFIKSGEPITYSLAQPFMYNDCKTYEDAFFVYYFNPTCTEELYSTEQILFDAYVTLRNEQGTILTTERVAEIELHSEPD